MHVHEPAGAAIWKVDGAELKVDGASTGAGGATPPPMDAATAKASPVRRWPWLCGVYRLSKHSITLYLSRVGSL